VFGSGCAAPGLHKSLASGWKRKTVCMLKTDGEVKLLLNAAEKDFVCWGREQAASIPASFCPVSCQGGPALS